MAVVYKNTLVYTKRQKDMNANRKHETTNLKLRKNEFVTIFQTVKGDSWSQLHNLERDSLTQACSKKTRHCRKFGISWQRNLQ